MEKIKAPAFTAHIMRNGKAMDVEAVSELGIFAVFLRYVHFESLGFTYLPACCDSNGEEEILNQPSGYLLRTKARHENEGGVASGFSVIDSPYLV